MQKMGLDSYKNLARQVKTGQHSSLMFDIQELPIIPQAMMAKAHFALTAYKVFIPMILGLTLVSVFLTDSGTDLVMLPCGLVVYVGAAFLLVAIYQMNKGLERYKILGVSPAFLDKLVEKSQLLKGNVTSVTPIAKSSQVEIGYSFTVHLTKQLTGTFYTSASQRLPSGSQVTVIYYNDSLHTLLIPKNGL